MNNPRKELPLDACNSREEIEDWYWHATDGMWFDRFKAALARMEAIASAPRCKSDLSKICMGCRDFIVAFHKEERGKQQE